MSTFAMADVSGFAATTASRYLAPSDYPAALDRLFELFVTNPDLQLKPGWQDTAMSWLIAVLLLALAMGCILVAAQWWRIRTRNGIPARVNSVKGQTKYICLLGMPVAVLALVALRFASDDYLYFINIPGLLNSAGMCILAYVLLVVAGHYSVLRFAK